jgi:hypothetical protein
MAGKVDRAHTYFLRAVDGEGWELWGFSDGRRAHFIRRLAQPSEVPGATVVALPAARTFCFATWLATSDRSVIPEMLQLLLEQHGLLLRNSARAMMDFRVVDSRDNQSLAVATVLQPEFPAELTLQRATRFEPSALTLPLPQDRLVVWREQGRLAVAVTRGKESIHFQVLGDREISEQIALELKCIVLELEAHRLCHKFLGAVLWGDFSDEEGARIEKIVGLRVSREAIPAPNLPATASRLVPPAVDLLRSRKRRRDRIRLGVFALLALYAVAILSLIGYLEWQRLRVNQLQREVRVEQPTVGAIESTADRWRKVEWAVDPRLYPVELLHRVANLLPGEGMRLTGFEVQKGKVFIHGEASTAPAAFKFAEGVKADPALQMFQWQMPSPRLRADGRAEFTVEGDPKIAKID